VANKRNCSAATARATVWRVTAKKARKERDILAEEEPLEIRVRGQSIAVTMRTPGHDAELAAGFLLTEGILSRREDILEIARCEQSDQPQNTLNVFLAPRLAVDFAKLTRHVFASSSCGLCGKASIEAVHQHFPPLDSQFKVVAKTLFKLPQKMRMAQKAFAKTGGLHAAALFDEPGNLIFVREDVGRHNAVDKVIGAAFLKKRFPLNKHVLLVSGRASFEIMQKALAARIPVVAAISAPSSLAVEFASESKQALVGFLRDKMMNVYSTPTRIV
jgi:FdhD protein